MMRYLWQLPMGILLSLLMSACESSIDARSDDAGEPPSSTPAGSDVATPNTTTTATTPTGADPALSGVTWLGTTVDVSGWPQTASLDASVGGGMVRLNYDKAKVWPSRNGVVGNCWVFFNYRGQAYASTFDYLRPGQTAKEANFSIPVGGSNWRPSRGETVGFMVSGLCRSTARNVSERSNVDWVTWP